MNVVCCELNVKQIKNHLLTLEFKYHDCIIMIIMIIIIIVVISSSSSSIILINCSTNNNNIIIIINVHVIGYK